MPTCPHDPAFARLTKRHIEVLGTMRRASRQSEIASELSISVATLKSHLKTLYEITETTSMLALSNWWTVNARTYIQYIEFVGGLTEPERRPSRLSSMG